MCIVCNAPDATYNYNNTYTNTYIINNTYTITYSNIQVRRVLGKNHKKTIVKKLSAAVLFDYHWENCFYCFIGCEACLAIKTFAPSFNA